MKNRSIQILLVAALATLLLSLASKANSASFDCQKAKSTNEILICGYAELSRLDDEMATVYKEALQNSPNSKQIAANQRDEWTQREKNCTSKPCLIDWFLRRQIYFNSQPSQKNVHPTAVQLASASLSLAEKALKEKDYATAFRLFKPLAEHGNSEAQANLGLMYELGRGTDKDLLEAFKWYLSAAKLGTACAQTNLGLAYANGRGTEKNEKEAAKWFRNAALQGNSRAQKILGSMYNQGLSTPQEYKSAADWINPSNLVYIAKMERNYRKRIHFDPPNAERLIREFDIDCNAPKKNGHYLPLINLLYARLATVDREDMWIETTIQERGGEVRILDALHTPKEVLHTTPIFYIDKWGELHTIGGLKSQAVNNACFDSYGPIWLLE